MRYLIAAIALLAVPASASATPILSGTYSLAVHYDCQARAAVDSNTGILKFNKRNDLGLTGAFAGTITFDSNAGTYTSSGLAIIMSNIYEKFSDGSKMGFKATPGTETDSGSYSNTNTTLTLKGSFTYTVAYGHVDGNGIADSLTGIWENTDQCIWQIGLQVQ